MSGVRAELDANAGAVVTSVVSVRRADGEAMGKREENLATRRKATLAREPRNVAAPPIWDGNDVEGRLQGDGHEDVTEGFDPLA